MTDDNKQIPVESLGEMIGKNFGSLISATIFQARATMILASAIKKDPAVADETKEAMDECLVMIDEVVSAMEACTNEKTAASFRQFLESRHE